MVSRDRHLKKEIADALRNAERAGLRVTEVHRGHRRGEVRCDACQENRGVWTTPRDSAIHAKQIDRFSAAHGQCAT